MSKELFYDSLYTSLNHKGEELCGDKVEIIKTPNSITMVLADGLGSGVKANILATLTSKIVCTMLSNGVSIEECMNTIMKTLPVCKVRHVAYSTFSIAQIIDNQCILIQYDNPRTLVFRNGVNYDYPYIVRKIDGKEIIESHFEIKPEDSIFLFSDGVIHAGVGKFFNFGWTLDEVKKHIEIFYKDNYNAKALSSLVAKACNDLYDSEPGDDTSVGVVKIKEKEIVSLMIGPPVDMSLDDEMCEKFLSTKGYHITCGGSTAHVVSRYLKTDIITNIEYHDIDIPPTAYMDGIDLVTEGVLTLHKVHALLKELNDVGCIDYDYSNKLDGASLIIKFLLEKSTTINFFIGRALNPAHQKYDFPINFNSKFQMIQEIMDELKKFGRDVFVNYF